MTTQDSDDWSHPQRIQRQVKLLENDPRVVATSCVGVRMSSAGRFEMPQPSRLLDSLCHPSIMYRKEDVLRMVGYWDCVRIEADSEYLARLMRLYGKRVFRNCEEPLVIQLRRGGSLTTAKETQNVGSAVGEDRRVYRACAHKFHRRMTRQTGRLDLERWRRPFPAPERIRVSDELVREALTWE